MCWFFPLSVNCSIMLQKPALVFRVLQIEGSSRFLWPPSSWSTYLPRDREVPVGASRTLFRIAGALNANKAWKRSPTIFDKFSNDFLAVYKSIVYKKSERTDKQLKWTVQWEMLTYKHSWMLFLGFSFTWTCHTQYMSTWWTHTVYVHFLNMELIWHWFFCQ